MKDMHLFSIEGETFYIIFRLHKDSMIKLRNLLADSSKARRHRRKLLNLQITMIAWITEVFGFFVVFLGVFIFGHENNLITSTLQTVSFTIYFIIVPSVILLNSNQVKSVIVDSHLYLGFVDRFNRHFSNQVDQENDDEHADT